MKRKTDQLVAGQLMWTPQFPRKKVVHNDEIPSPAALFSSATTSTLMDDHIGNIPFGSAVTVLKSFKYASHLNRIQDEYVIKVISTLGVGYMWRGFLSDKNPPK